MAEQKKRLERFTSPEGMAVFPKLNTPDTKFKAEGEYAVKLKLPADSAGAKAMVARIDKMAEKARDTAQAALDANPKKYGKGAKAPEAGSLPYKLVLDDTGEETGDIEFRFGAKASGKSKDGREWERKLALFDRFGKPTTEIVRGGARIVVSYAPDGWVNPKNEWGVKLYLEAVQVRQAGGGGRSAEEYGFAADAPEEGEEAGSEMSGGEAEATPDF